MARYCSHFIAAILVGATLTACTYTSPPAGEPTSSTSSTPPATATSPTSTPPSADPPPQQVVGVSAIMGGGSGEVLLRWTQNAELDVVSYIVLRASSSEGSLTEIGTVSREEVTEFEFAPFVDSEATVGYYRVRAVDSAGQEGPMSAEVCGASLGHSC